MNVTSQFEYLLSKVQDLAFEEKRDSLETMYTQYTKPGKADQHDFRSATAAGLGQMGYTPEAGMFHQDEYVPGNERITRFKTFTIGCIFPWELIDDMAANDRVKEDKLGLFKTISNDFAESAVWTRETITADFFIRGNATTATNTYPGTFRDGKALFATDHPLLKSGATWNNYPGAASMDSYVIAEMITMMENIPTEAGRPQGNVKNIGIVFGRYWSWRAYELFNSDKQVDTNNNNANILKKPGRKFTLIELPYLGDTFKGFAVINLDKHQLMRFEKKAPTTEKTVDPLTGVRIFKCVMRYAIDALSSKDVVFCAGP